MNCFTDSISLIPHSQPHRRSKLSQIGERIRYLPLPSLPHTHIPYLLGKQQNPALISNSAGSNVHILTHKLHFPGIQKIFVLDARHDTWCLFLFSLYPPGKGLHSKTVSHLGCKCKGCILSSQFLLPSPAYFLHSFCSFLPLLQLP